jgi:hypothetical protein
MPFLEAVNRASHVADAIHFLLESHPESELVAIFATSDFSDVVTIRLVFAKGGQR